jgi:hypothetical protein
MRYELTVVLAALYEKRVKLNDQIILIDQSFSNDDEVTTTNIGDMVAGRNLRALVRNAIQSRPLSSDTDDDTDDNNKSNDGTIAIDMMDDDAAEQARKYFGVL